MCPVAELGHPIPYLWLLLGYYANNKCAMPLVELCSDTPRQRRLSRAWFSVDANKSKRIGRLAQQLDQISLLVALYVRLSRDYVPAEGNHPLVKPLLASSIRRVREQIVGENLYTPIEHCYVRLDCSCWMSPEQPVEELPEPPPE